MKQKTTKLSHAQHFIKSPQKYATLSKIAKEQHVYDLIKQNADMFHEEELAHAMWYILKLGGVAQ